LFPEIASHGQHNHQEISSLLQEEILHIQIIEASRNIAHEYPLAISAVLDENLPQILIGASSSKRIG
jgi:hypothetical protein